MRIREVELKCWTRYIIGAVAAEEEGESTLRVEVTTIKTGVQLKEVRDRDKV